MQSCYRCLGLRKVDPKNIGVTKLNRLNKIAGFIDKDQNYDVVNMILSMTRWLIWKRHCSKKYGKPVTLPLVVHELKYNIVKHTELLIKSKMNLLGHTMEQLHTILNFLAS